MSVTPSGGGGPAHACLMAATRGRGARRRLGTLRLIDEDGSEVVRPPTFFVCVQGALCVGQTCTGRRREAPDTCEGGRETVEERSGGEN